MAEKRGQARRRPSKSPARESFEPPSQSPFFLFRLSWISRLSGKRLNGPPGHNLGETSRSSLPGWTGRGQYSRAALAAPAGRPYLIAFFLPNRHFGDWF